jgi:hypothetical protein
MKKVALVLAVGAVLTACGTTGPQPTAQQKFEVQRAQTSIGNIPEWFTDIPKDDGAIYATGDAVSSSASGALSVARANAFEGICQTAGGKVRSQTKVYRVDTEKSSTSTSTTAIRNFCPDVDVTGATVTKSSFVQEGGRIRAFVMVKLPIGDNNVLARTKQRDQLERQAVGGMKQEFKELDEITRQDKEPAPTSSVAPAAKEPVVVTPVPETKNLSERAKELPHQTISDQKVKSQVEAAIARGDAVIMTHTVN